MKVFINQMNLIKTLNQLPVEPHKTAQHIKLKIVHYHITIQNINNKVN